jgi:hypothetical protein
LADTGAMREGHTTQCGECKREAVRLRMTTHNLSRSPEYRVWVAARERCQNPNTRNFKNYGGRGIRMAERWRQSFAEFYKDMGPCPKGHSLDRIDNDGPYAAKNCRWATIATQTNNRRNTRKLTFLGQTRILSEWATITGLSLDTLNARFKAKWPTERMLTEPRHYKSSSH